MSVHGSPEPDPSWGAHCLALTPVCVGLILVLAFGYLIGALASCDFMTAALSDGIKA